MDKLIGALRSVVDNVGHMRLTGAPRAMVYGFILLIFAAAWMFLTGWGWQWLINGKPELDNLNRFLQTLTSASFVAAVGFIGRALVDKDGDGTPDVFEGDDRDDKRGIGR